MKGRTTDVACATDVREQAPRFIKIRNIYCCPTNSDKAVKKEHQRKITNRQMVSDCEQ